MSYRLIIAGSRGRDITFSDIERGLAAAGWEMPSMVITGGARGPDTIGARWANATGIQSWVIRADWDGLGKRAGIVRNERMAEEGSRLLAFWDGESRGTKHMIEAMEKRGRAVHVVTTPTHPHRRIGVPMTDEPHPETLDLPDDDRVFKREVIERAQRLTPVQERFAAHLLPFATGLYRDFGRPVPLLIEVDAEVGLSLGIAPGDWCAFAVSHGAVVVRSRRDQ